MSVGWGGAPEVPAIYQRARSLAAKTEQLPAIHPLLIQGLFYHWTKRDVTRVREFMDDQRAIARQTNDAAIISQVHWLDASLLFWRGDVAAAQEDFNKAMAAYQPGQDGARFVYGQDPGIACRAYASWNLCLAGYPDRAKQLITDCMARAEELHHPFTTLYSFLGAFSVNVLRRDIDAVLELAERTISMAQTYEAPFYVPYAGMQRAWARAHAGNVRPASVRWRSSSIRPTSKWRGR